MALKAFLELFISQNIMLLRSLAGPFGQLFCEEDALTTTSSSLLAALTTFFLQLLLDFPDFLLAAVFVWLAIGIIFTFSDDFMFSFTFLSSFSRAALIFSPDNSVLSYLTDFLSVFTEVTDFAMLLSLSTGNGSTTVDPTSLTWS